MKFKLIIKDKENLREIPNINYSIKDLLNDLKIDSDSMVSKKNNEIVHEDTLIEENDEIKLIQILYGG